MSAKYLIIATSLCLIYISGCVIKAIKKVWGIQAEKQTDVILKSHSNWFLFRLLFKDYLAFPYTKIRYKLLYIWLPALNIREDPLTIAWKNIVKRNIISEKEFFNYKLIDNWQSKKLSCSLCEKTKSVKYIRDNKYYCNSCISIFNVSDLYGREKNDKPNTKKQ